MSGTDLLEKLRRDYLKETYRKRPEKQPVSSKNHYRNFTLPSIAASAEDNDISDLIQSQKEWTRKHALDLRYHQRAQSMPVKDVLSGFVLDKLDDFWSKPAVAYESKSKIDFDFKKPSKIQSISLPKVSRQVSTKTVEQDTPRPTKSIGIYTDPINSKTQSCQSFIDVKDSKIQTRPITPKVLISQGSQTDPIRILQNDMATNTSKPNTPKVVTKLNDGISREILPRATTPKLPLFVLNHPVRVLTDAQQESDKLIDEDSLEPQGQPDNSIQSTMMSDSKAHGPQTRPMNSKAPQEQVKKNDAKPKVNETEILSRKLVDKQESSEEELEQEKEQKEEEDEEQENDDDEKVDDEDDKQEDEEDNEQDPQQDIDTLNTQSEDDEQSESLEDLDKINSSKEDLNSKEEVESIRKQEKKSILKKPQSIPPISNHRPATASTSSTISGYATSFKKNPQFHIDPRLFDHFRTERLSRGDVVTPESQTKTKSISFEEKSTRSDPTISRASSKSSVPDANWLKSVESYQRPLLNPRAKMLSDIGRLSNVTELSEPISEKIDKVDKPRGRIQRISEKPLESKSSGYLARHLASKQKPQLVKREISRPKKPSKRVNPVGNYTGLYTQRGEPNVLEYLPPDPVLREPYYPYSDEQTSSTFYNANRFR